MGTAAKQDTCPLCGARAAEPGYWGHAQSCWVYRLPVARIRDRAAWRRGLQDDDKTPATGFPESRGAQVP